LLERLLLILFMLEVVQIIQQRVMD
jgi:hypothetical protein